MRRGDYWLVFTALCRSYPGGVEVFYENAWWRCIVRTPDGVKSFMAQRIEDVVEVVATNLGVGKDA